MPVTVVGNPSAAIRVLSRVLSKPLPVINKNAAASNAPKAPNALTIGSPQIV
jgi:hypothetical protein